MKQKNRKILVVEDDQSVAKMLGMALRSAGFEVEHVSSGGAALLALDSGGHGAVLLDLGLPDKRGGEVIRRLTSMTGVSKPFWLVLSAMDFSDAEKTYSVSRDRFISKPYDPWDVVKRIERDISNHNGRDRHR